MVQMWLLGLANEERSQRIWEEPEMNFPVCGVSDSKKEGREVVSYSYSC